jgi:hypothetical protein
MLCSGAQKVGQRCPKLVQSRSQTSADRIRTCPLGMLWAVPAATAGRGRNRWSRRRWRWHDAFNKGSRSRIDEN